MGDYGRPKWTWLSGCRIAFLNWETSWPALSSFCKSATAGSATLRRAVIMEAETDVNRLNLREVPVDSSPKSI